MYFDNILLLFPSTCRSSPPSHPPRLKLFLQKHSTTIKPIKTKETTPKWGKKLPNCNKIMQQLKIPVDSNIGWSATEHDACPAEVDILSVTPLEKTDFPPPNRCHSGSLVSAVRQCSPRSSTYWSQINKNTCCWVSERIHNCIMGLNVLVISSGILMKVLEWKRKDLTSWDIFPTVWKHIIIPKSTNHISLILLFF